jgi:hypothetical protein
MTIKTKVEINDNFKEEHLGEDKIYIKKEYKFEEIKEKYDFYEKEKKFKIILCSNTFNSGKSNYFKILKYYFLGSGIFFINFFKKKKKRK